MPVHFLENVEAGDVAYIQVSNGDTEVGFSIEDRLEISHVISNIQNAAVVRDKRCYGYDGMIFHL